MYQESTTLITMNTRRVWNELVMKDDTRPDCKYGSLCYQKNELHLKKYKHPPKRKVKEQSHGGSPKRHKSPQEASAADTRTKDIHAKDKPTKDTPTNNTPKNHTPIKHTLTKLTPTKDKPTNDTPTNDTSKNHTPIKHTLTKLTPTKDKPTNDTSKNHTPIKHTLTKLTPTKDKPTNDKPTKDETTKDTPIKISFIKDNHSNDVLVSVRDSIKRMFLVDMPEDFYSFWEFCTSLCPKKPEDALRDCGLSLVGPYDVVSGKLREADSAEESEFLTRWRYYYDPPEFQTVLRGDDKKKFHMGYFRDEPLARPCFVASNSAAVDCVITPVAENLFGAVNSYLESSRRVCDPFRKMKLKKVQDAVQSWARDRGFDLDTFTAKMKDRESRVVARTFHKAGIVVPYNKKTELGYRPLPLSEGSLRSVLKRIAASSSEEERVGHMEALQPVLTAASIAGDECDFGTGLELGLDLFSHGHECLHAAALLLLCTAYALLDREPFARIAKAHLSKRRNIP